MAAFRECEASQEQENPIVQPNPEWQSEWTNSPLTHGELWEQQDGIPLLSRYGSVATVAFLSRILILGLLMLSCQIIPNHNPGDDVLRFDMRVSKNIFCIHGHACDRWTDLEGADNLNHGFQATSLWFLVLEPLTRWDAARFLSLAAKPSMRLPPVPEVCYSEGNLSQCHYDDQAWMESEEAHAFFPLFPAIVRSGANLLLRLLPLSLLPPTYEILLVLVALMLNQFFFVAAAVALYDCTLTLSKSSKDDSYFLASMAVLIFCFNPASVFFTTSYSESLFAMATFLGHALMARGRTTLAAIPWLVASYTRSNGTMNAIFLMLNAISLGLNKKLPHTFYFVFLSGLVASPVFLHDWQGFLRYCRNKQVPSWCADASQQWFFSLYAHIQRKHWNVGFLRYFQLKQIPNFILAGPVLLLGSLGAVEWIRRSWKEHRQNVAEIERKITSKRAFCLRLFDWGICALRCSIDCRTPASDDDTTSILMGPHMLQHYAVLAGTCLLGFLFAHVQISTRLIFSSCPAMYWYLVVVCFSRNKSIRVLAPMNLLCGKSVFIYCGSYILLGAIMHPNWLPWT